MNHCYLHFCSYWGVWSRVLGWEGGRYVEVNLTPIPACYSSSWKTDVIPIVIRRHGTARDWNGGRGDISTNQLPLHILEAMHTALGAELTDRLLTEDFLSQIDWSRYEKSNNAGAPLDMIRKGSLMEVTSTWREQLC